MGKPYTIAPSILSADFACLETEIKSAETNGAGIIHIDVMDGHFVPNLTMGPFIVAACKRITSLPLEVHLMIEQPDRLLSDFAKAGANRLIVHVETCPNLHRTLAMIREVGCSVGVALNPATPAVLVDPVLTMVDEVLVMTVNPGYGGQQFIRETLRKINKVRLQLDAHNPVAKIEVDGGITAETLPLARKAGAQIFVAGTSVFKHPKGIAVGMQALLAGLQVD
jgi:ribulose-phosphate 3-epimerase